ncbi:MAG: NAD(P)H-dependent oxidoreductase, partial [Rhodobacteraceae bacterium]|nr:NAD(P)H-dependent oxidoreductase [Paracoccaceae bacterium]
MIRALVVYCHPNPESFTAAVKTMTLRHLEHRGAETRLIDLYAIDFDPILTLESHAGYLDTNRNQAGIEAHVENLRWCNTLIFIYPTWWYGLPARLKGWLDRVLIPGVAFHMPGANARSIRPGL